MVSVKELRDIANILRRDVIKMTTAAGSGHPTTCMSCSEIISVLFFREMKYDVKNAFNQDNDEFVLSKGHAAPILYSVLYRAGAVRDDLMSLRKFGSSYEGHPLPSTFKWVKVATGSLGQGLSVGFGMALAAKMQKRNYRTYVLMGDSEVAEGSVYEAMQLASYYKLNNLCALVDVNRLGQSGQTMIGHDVKSYKKRFEGFGWNVLIVDGHDVNSIINAFSNAKKETKKPTIIIAKTFKGNGVSFLEDKEGWHGKSLNQEELKKALNELPDPKMPVFKIESPKKINLKFNVLDKPIKLSYSYGEMVATREAYGDALAKLGSINDLVVVTDAEVKNSTHALEFAKTKPERYVESFIMEQNMIGVALGLSVKGFYTFASTFACFLSRAHDQIRMAALSSGNLTICGSHSGISIGADGASQMALEDLAMFRALPDSIVFYPSDAVSTERIIESCIKLEGIKYIRTTRGKTPVIYSNNDYFPIGEFKILKNSNKDKIILVGAGITLHECLKAYSILKESKINAAVIDCYCVKPFDGSKFIKFAKSVGCNKVLVVEDHYQEGGIGEMIMNSLSCENIIVKQLAVFKFPHSGEPEELLEKYQIDCKAIVETVKDILK